ncbi:2OG-Fe(II) oxygenase [Microvirga sp. BT688]|uniref:2OG-Fe(II) oxygenase n=1 Tax=Microvirga sp. TaxID=1873136 RepID=UPI0016874696|nr:2OG-Fe(II) oxygenase [Microvirga sp.]MBD2750174.1 2OG-Fe(II) oxygenase [Microvirga sp.]
MSFELINVIDRDDLRKKFLGGVPVPWFKIDNFLRQDFAEQCAAAFPTFDKVKSLGVTHTNLNEKGKFQITDSELFPKPLKDLEEVLNGREFLELLEYVTDIPRLLPDRELAGGGLHATGARGHLDVHLDFNAIPERQLYRRLNILIYLNPEWKEQWGGEFELWDEDVKVCHQKFLPTFNRCVVFETNEVSFHGVRAVKCPDGQARKSFAAYYYTKEAPAHYPGYAHSTIFKARPDEKVKGIMMPVDQSLSTARRLFQRGTSKLKRLLVTSPE